MKLEGFIYVAVNDGSQHLATQSAISLRQHHPNADITIFTDQIVSCDIFNNIVNVPSVSPMFPEKPAYPNQGIIAKSTYIGQSPYRYTIFLDIDTYICDTLQPIFDVLQDCPGYDMAAAIDEAYVPVGDNVRHSVPYVFPRFNTGLVAYRKNALTDMLFTAFHELFFDPDNNATGNDENTFSVAVYRSGVRNLTLPPEYNCRFIFPYILRQKAAVLHGRPLNTTYEQIEAVINAQAGIYRVMNVTTTLGTHKPQKGFRRR